MSQETPADKYLQDMTTLHLTALVDARTKIHNEIKNEKSKFNLTTDKTGLYDHSYISMEKLYQEVEPILLEHNLLSAVTQEPTEDQHVLLARMRITHSISKGYDQAFIRVQIEKQTAQGLRSALTYATRSLYMQLLGLPIEKDDDGHDANKTANDKEVREYQQRKEIKNGTMHTN